MSRFEGDEGARLLVEALNEQRLVLGNHELANELAAAGELLHLKADDVLITEGATDTTIYFLLAGSFAVIVKGRQVAVRAAGTHVGEMAAIEASQPRSATVIAAEESVALKLEEGAFSELGRRYPQLWRGLAKELARRLRQRNTLVANTHKDVRAFIMSSAEALPIAQAIQEALDHDPATVTIWTDGVFKASHYPIEALEKAVDQSDFAIAIAQPDDLVEERGEKHWALRDNVIFELGFFMGRLGRQRTILIEPRGEEIKLPSDLVGITTITYKAPQKKGDLLTAIGPACNKLRNLFEDLGPNN
jgi:CRP/FNR family transcriptional regulator, cyclic AMP receptor protein